MFTSKGPLIAMFNTSFKNNVGYYLLALFLLVNFILSWKEAGWRKALSLLIVFNRNVYPRYKNIYIH